MTAWIATVSSPWHTVTSLVLSAWTLPLPPPPTSVHAISVCTAKTSHDVVSEFPLFGYAMCAAQFSKRTSLANNEPTSFSGAKKKKREVKKERKKGKKKTKHIHTHTKKKLAPVMQIFWR